jgi:predicted RNA-binding Zn ribbon-like protein
VQARYNRRSVRTAQLDRWPWLGAPLALDLANSLVQIRPGATRDLLATDEDLDEWLAHERDRLPGVDRAAERLDAFRALRDALHKLLTAAAAGEPLPRAAVRMLNATSARSDGHLRLTLRAGAPSAEAHGSGTPLDRALSTIARSAIELLAATDRDRLRLCPAPSCGMFYLGRPDQEWCSAACGNRARAARHYARRRDREATSGAAEPHQKRVRRRARPDTP